MVSGMERQPSSPLRNNLERQVIFGLRYNSIGSPGVSKRCTQITLRFMPTWGAHMHTPGCSESVTDRYLRLPSHGSTDSFGSIATTARKQEHREWEQGAIPCSI